MKNPDNYTHREIEIMSYLLLGLPDKLIASEMNISVNTVRSFERNMRTKSGVNNRTELVLYGQHNEFPAAKQ